MQISVYNFFDLLSTNGKKCILCYICEDKLYYEKVSKTYLDSLGYTASSFEKSYKEDLSLLFSQYDFEMIKKALEYCKNSNEPYDFSVQIKHASGNYIIANGQCIFCGPENGKYFFICISNENKNTKTVNSVNTKLFHENERRFEEALSFGKIDTFDYDIIEKKIIINKSFIKSNLFFKETLEDVPNYFIKNSIIVPESLTDFNDMFLAIKKGQNVEKDLWFHFHDSTSAVCLRTFASVELDKNNTPVLAHFMCMNVTEILNAEKNFKHRANSVLRANPDAVATFQINISKNTCTNASSGVSSMQPLLSCTTFDMLLSKIVGFIPDKTEGIRFINTFSRGSLISSFENGDFQVKLDHHLKIKSTKDEWVSSVIDIFKNPLTSEIEAALHIKNIHNAKVIESLINGIVTREYNYVALCYIKTDSYVLVDRFNNNKISEEFGFISKFHSDLSAQIQIDSERERVLALFTMQNIINNIHKNGEYVLQYNTNEDPAKNHHKLLHFAFLDSKKEIITLSCTDMTNIYNEELAQKKLLSDAVIAAEKANMAKTEFLSLVSHDIRTPLNGIMGMIQLAKLETNVEKIHNYLEKAEMSSVFLLGLINDILDMSKMESGRIELHPELYDYKELYDYINSIIKPLCDKKNIKFSMHLENLVKYIYIDKLRLNQILFNLLSNACKYTNAEGNISLTIHNEKLDENKCEISFIIKDNGIGMSKDFQEHLFETFSQENRITFNQNEGSGLGLSITKDLINLMNGDITVNSEINEGTIVTVKLVVDYFNKGNEPEVTQKQRTSKRSYSGYTFLVCEDNIINQEIALELLKSTGANVEIAENGQRGIDLYLSKSPYYYGAIFMDIRMPVMDGLQASRYIRESNRADSLTIPIIAMTANAMSNDKMECIEAGMNGIVTKPIDVSYLFNTMNKLIL